MDYNLCGIYRDPDEPKKEKEASKPFREYLIEHKRA